MKWVSRGLLPPKILISLFLLIALNLTFIAPQAHAGSYINSGLILDLEAQNYNSGTGIWSDTSGSGYNFTATNSPTYNSADNSVGFSGSSQYFTAVGSGTPLNFNSGQPFTIQVVYKPVITSNGSAPI
jgi:hypothetical protein